MSLIVGVKFCGNCNPHIDSLDILGQVKEILPNCRFVTHEEPMDVLLVMVGCPINCAEYSDFTGPVVAVAGETLNLIECPANRLALEIANALEKVP